MYACTHLPTSGSSLHMSLHAVCSHIFVEWVYRDRSSSSHVGTRHDVARRYYCYRGSMKMLLRVVLAHICMRESQVVAPFTRYDMVRQL